ncbi:MAG: protein kinase domain-containing protein [Planctomycetota bacterium]|jgi:tRNA A-37 threonylcarbamoyl transferase component Bud32
MEREVILLCKCGKSHRMKDPGKNTRIRCKTADISLTYECFCEEGYRLRSKNRDFMLSDEKTTFGRSQENTYCLEKGMLSRSHSAFYKTDDGYELEDLGSRNGTFIDKKKIEPGKRYKLLPGMLVSIGGYHFRYLMPGDIPEDEESENQEDEMVGKCFGNFEVKSFLGQGGMGRVYKAVDKESGKEAVVKTMLPEMQVKTSLMERFLREIETTSRLSHPNIVSFLGSGQEDETVYFAMEFFEGVELRKRFKKKPGPVAGVVKVAKQTAAAVEAAHSENIIHRDIKPENILADKYGNVRILDFGIAKVLQDEEYASLTMSNAAIGTPAYMAPEQSMGAKHVDHRADIYSLGATLYFCLTGDSPFGGSNLVHIMRAIKEGCTPVAEVRDDVPADLDFIISKAMSPDPDERFSTASEMLEALEQL